MSTSAAISLDRVELNDLTLAADGLSEFLPAGPAPESDSMLAVSSLGDLFPARVVDDPGDLFNPGSEPFVNAAAVKGDDVHEAFEPGQGLKFDGLFESDRVVPSDIQRAAMEFQRFAEEFHAFAIENQQR